MKAKATALLLCFCSILLIIGLAGCATNGTSSGTTTAVSEKSEDEQVLDETVFPKDKVVDVKITIDESEFQNLLDNASAEEYKEATVAYNGHIFENVGIRAKGNLSLRSVVNMTDSDRYSFKISFDEYVNQTLEGISKINLNNNYSDASYMREFLSYELAEDMGLPTPKYSYVNVYVNDELWGFYLAVEQIGDTYLKRNFGNSYGALYKANGGTGSELNWLDTIESYTGLDLKSEKTNNNILLDMLDELNNGTDIESVLDVDEALGSIALNVLSGNMDSYLGQLKHNYYLYEDDGVFAVLPWDYNMAFGGFGGSGILIDEPTSGAMADRPLVAKLLAVDRYKETYHDIIASALEGYLSEEKFTARVQELRELISTYVKADPSSFYTYDEYEAGITSVLAFHTTQTTSIAQQLDGTIASAGDGSGSGGMGPGGMGGGMPGGRPGGMGGDRPAMGQFVQAGEDGFTPNGQGMQGGAGGFAPDGQGMQGGAGGFAPDGQGMQGGAGGFAPDGQGMQGGAGGFAPDGQGMQGGFGGQGGERPNFQGGMPGGMPGGYGQQVAIPQATTKDAVTVGVVIVILLLSCVFVAFYKRKRL